MRIFVTGGTGFIGTHLVKKLKEKGHHLFLLTKNLAEIDQWRDEVKRFHPEAALHLAWEGIPDYSTEMSIKNLQYGLNLFLMLTEIGCPRVITTGSCWEYGEPNAFVVAKNTLYLMGREIAKDKKMDFIWTRLFYVYGPGQRKEALIPYLIDCAQRDKKPVLKTPRASHDFIYVADAAAALVFLIKKGQSTVYDIGSGRITKVTEIVKMISEGKKPTSIARGFRAKIAKIKRDTGWQPQTSLEQGIEKMTSYYRRD